MNIVEELKRVIKQLGKFPTHGELVKLKEFKLRNKIISSKIKLSEYASQLGMESAKPRDYWTEEKLFIEFKKICDEQGGWPDRNVWHKKYPFFYLMIYRSGGDAEYYRNKLGVTLIPHPPKNCKQCNEQFIPEGANAKRQNFCCAFCNDEFFRLRQNTRIKEKRSVEKTCPICAKIFIPQNTIKQKYCERRCWTRFRKRLDKALRTSLEYLGLEKKCTAADMLGYDAKQLLEHLETFPTWPLLKDKEWHLDHIFPVKAFVDHGITDVKTICCLKNLQPLLAADNLTKGSKYDQIQFLKWLNH